METTPYQYRDPLTLKTVDEVFDEIDRFLRYLESNTHILDGSILVIRPHLEWYGTQMDWLKRYYERAERLMIDEAD